MPASPECTSAVFTSTLSKLDSDFADIWSEIVPKIPTTAGVSFGSCYTSCGSVGITDVSVFSHTLEDSSPSLQVSFPTCGNTNLAVLIVPLEIALDCTLALRATGVGHLWPTPTVGNDGVVYNNTLNLTGNILITVPVVGKSFQFTGLTVDVMFTGNWSLGWPDEQNVLFNTIPVNELAIKYIHSFNYAIRSSLSRAIKTSLQSANVIIDCSFPVMVPATCNSSTRTTSEFCDPCDTCCTCMMQQRCDGECSTCECVQCDNTWHVTIFLSVLLFFLAAVIIFWSVFI